MRGGQVGSANHDWKGGRTKHHAGYLTSDHVEASVNREHPLFNLLTCNLGLHTAHHMKPGLHWSELPELHAEIRAEIPQPQLLQTFW